MWATRRIGERLIPACQKSLAKTDPQKIDFRFYATNDKIPQLLESPHGLIVIPEQLVEKLQNDDQVAAVLAAGGWRRSERGCPTSRI